MSQLTRKLRKQNNQCQQDFFFSTFFLSKQVSPEVQISLRKKKEEEEKKGQRKRKRKAKELDLFSKPPAVPFPKVMCNFEDTHFIQLLYIWNFGVVPLVLHAK
jgi:hypothetical protein